MQVVGRVSLSLQPDAADAHVRRESWLRMRAEIDWAAHLSMQALILPTPSALNTANYAQVLTHVRPPPPSEVETMKLALTASIGSENLPSAAKDGVIVAEIAVSLNSP